MPSKLMEYFNRSPRIGTLSTADKAGKTDSAVLGSPRMTDEKTVVVGLGQNRTLAYLQQNPHAVYLIMEPGCKPHGLEGDPGLPEGKEHRDIGAGARLLQGPDGENCRGSSGQYDQCGVKFEIEEVRPLIDMGQGWEKSV